VRQMMSQISPDLSLHGPEALLRYFEDDPNFLMAADGKLQFDGVESDTHPNPVSSREVVTNRVDLSFHTR
jgi:hypothetical protein